MQIIQGDLTEITKGVIVHQVNCCDRIGAGLSGQLIRKYPVLEKQYHTFCRSHSKSDRFGLAQPVRVSDRLVVVNLFTQMNYGNSAVTGVVYTDPDALIDGLKRICARYAGQRIYIPERIGCGLAGGNWPEISRRIEEAGLDLICVQYRP